MEADGEPTVFATPYVDIAIFRALINTKNTFGKSENGFWINGGKPHFSSTRNLLVAAKQKVGKVYVLDKQKFENFEGMQCRSKGPISSLETIEVTFDDLPKSIHILE